MAETDRNAGTVPFEWERVRGRAWIWFGLPVLTAVVLATTAQAVPEFYGTYIEPELGVLELLHVVQTVAAAVLAALLLSRREVRRVPWFAAWLTLALAGCVYTAGEEASWGQHIFAWGTPESWQQLNDQGETNLHNISSWLDQKPRLMLQVAILGGALALPLLRRTRFYPRHPKLAYLVPTIRCVPAAALVLLTRVEDTVLDMAVGGQGLFYRTSEVEELFMYAVVLIYLADLLARTRRYPPPA